MHRPSFTRQMEAAKRNAAHKRNMGRHVGASAKGWDWQRPAGDKDAWSTLVRAAKDGWRIARNEARNDFSAACLNGPQEEDDYAIPF